MILLYIVAYCIISGIFFGFLEIKYSLAFEDKFLMSLFWFIAIPFFFSYKIIILIFGRFKK
jgi:hypothetical protein